MGVNRWLSTWGVACCALIGQNFSALPAFAQETGARTKSYWIDGNGINALVTPGNLPLVTAGSVSIEKGPGSRAATGTAKFEFRQNGVLVSETSVSAVAAVRSGRIYAEVEGPINTGVAIVNPNEEEALISFYFTNQDGTDFGHGSARVLAKQQISRFLNQSPFNVNSSVNGTFTFNSTVPIGVVALRGFTNERQEFLMATLPVTPVEIVGGHTTHLPHFAVGGGWSTEIVLVNPTDGPIAGTLQFMSPGTVEAAATPADMTIDSRTASAFEFLIPRRSFRKLRPTSSAAMTATGSVLITLAPGQNAPSSFAIFSFQNGGVRVGEASVAAVRAASAFRLYAEHYPRPADGSIQTGVAVCNPSTEPVEVRFELTQVAGGTPYLTGSKMIPGRGQTAFFLNQIPGFESIGEFYRGILRVSTTSPSGIAVTGLRGRWNERGDFLITTVPPVDEAGGDTPGTMLFPLIVDGGGYATRFALYSPQPGPTVFGTLRITSENALELNWSTSQISTRTSALQSHYTFDDGAKDSAFMRADGTLVGGAIARNGMLDLNGTTAYVQFDTTLIPTSGSYSVALFVRHSSLQSQFVEWISQGRSGGPPFYFGHDPTRNLRASDLWQDTGVAAAPADGRFHHYSLVVDTVRRQSRIYIDGTLRATRNATIQTAAGGTGTRFGRQFGDDGYEYHAGDIDDVRIFGGVLTDSEIAALAVPDPKWSINPPQ